MTAESPSWNGNQLAVYLIAFMLAIGPFFNGMFFEPIRLVGVALACLAYWLWYTGKREMNLTWNGVDWSVLAWFLSYVLASINPVLPRGHLSVLLDMVAFVAVYSVMRGVNARLERSLTRILVVSGAVMATLSVARFGGVTWLDRRVVDLVIDGRLSGGFQYPNTYAVWLFCIALLTLREARTPRLGSMFLSIGGLLAGTFMLTLSRGALVAAPAAYLVVVLLGAREDRLFTAWAGILTWVPAFVLGSAAFRAFQQHQPAVGLAALSICALPPLASPYLVRFTHLLWSRKRTWGIGAVAVILLGVVVAGPSVAHKVRPVLLTVTDNRMTGGYDLSDMSISGRLMFDSVAWNIMSERHFLGAGGRGWTKLYLPLRSYPYFTTEVHNHFLQTGVEAGLIGLLAFTAMFVFCLITAWRSRKGAHADNSFAVWTGVAAYIAIHSAFDFDLSYISLLLLLAVAVGVISSRSTLELGAARRWLPVWHHGLAAATILAVITVGSLYVSKRALLASDEAWARGDITGTVSKVKLARQTDPLGSEPWVRMAALTGVTAAAETGLPDAKSLLTNAQALDAYDPGITLQLASIAIQEKQWAQAVALAMRADSLVPLDQELNAAVASTMWSAIAGAVQVEDTSTARTLAAGMKDYKAHLNRRFQQAEPYAQYARAPYGYTSIVHLHLGQGLTVAGDYAAAVGHLRVAAQSHSEEPEATQWLFVALDLGGSKQEAAQLRQSKPDLINQFLQSELYRKVIHAAKAS